MTILNLKDARDAIRIQIVVIEGYRLAVNDNRENM